MSGLFLRFVTLLVAFLSAALLVSNQAEACEMCRRSGTTAFHQASLGEPLGKVSDDDTTDLVAPGDGANDVRKSGIAPRFETFGGTWPQPGGKGTVVEVTYSYQNMFDGGILMPNGQPLPADLIRDSFEEALGLWAEAAPLVFREVADDGKTYGQSTQFGQIRFNHIFYDGADTFERRPTTKAIANWITTPGDIAGDISFDRYDRWQEIGTLHYPDILGVATHEIGHALGLYHSTVVQPGEFWYWKEGNPLVDHYEPKGAANMFWICTRFSGLGTGYLYQDDIAGIQYLYGAGGGQGGVIPLSVTPEPASALLLLCALLPLGLRRAR